MMQTRFAMSAVVLVLSAGASVQTATACSKEAVAGAVDRWTTVLAENNPDTIVALYSKDAVLWGTLSPTVRSDPDGLKAYFVGAFQALPKLTVKFGDQLIRVYGDTAIDTGYYTFSYTQDGEAKSLPARYSFTFVKEGNDCKIVDHHSSAMPAPPRVTSPLSSHGCRLLIGRSGSRATIGKAEYRFHEGSKGEGTYPRH